MAEIAVERRHGFPWWASLFIIVAIGLIIWGIVAWSTRTGNAERARYAPGVGVVPTTNQPITDLQALYSPTDVNAVIGRTVNINGARVVGVVGSGVFWIGEPGGQQVLVDEAGTRQNGANNAASNPNIAVGDTVTVTGHVAPMLTWPQAQTQWNVNQSLRPTLETHRVYILATGVNVTAQK